MPCAVTLSCCCEGRVYHLDVRHGEVANRILSVGDPARAERIAQLLDNVCVCVRVRACVCDCLCVVQIQTESRFVRSSVRGLVTHTGLFNNVPVSIIATGVHACVLLAWARGES